MLVLALGIGANSVIFSVINAVLLRSLPFPDSNRIVRVFETNLQQQSKEAIAAANFLDWRDQNQVFESMAAYREESFSLTGGEQPERVSGLVTTASLFAVLGVEPMLGRIFQSDDELLGSSRVAIISQSLWQRRFAVDPNIIGQKVGQGMVLASIGVGIGLAVALALTRVLKSLLFGVEATDPATFVIVSALLTGEALGACFAPALRATRVDPMKALKCE